MGRHDKKCDRKEEKEDCEPPHYDVLSVGRLFVKKLKALKLSADKAKIKDLEAKEIKAEQIYGEQVAAKRVGAECLTADSVKAQKVDAECVNAVNVKAESVDAHKVHAECVSAVHVKAEKVEAEKVDAECINAVYVKAEKVEAEKVDAECVNAVNVKAENVEAEHVEAVSGTFEELETVNLTVTGDLVTKFWDVELTTDLEGEEGKARVYILDEFSGEEFEVSFFEGSVMTVRVNQVGSLVSLTLGNGNPLGFLGFNNADSFAVKCDDPEAEANAPLVLDFTGTEVEHLITFGGVHVVATQPLAPDAPTTSGLLLVGAEEEEKGALYPKPYVKVYPSQGGVGDLCYCLEELSCETKFRYDQSSWPAAPVECDNCEPVTEVYNAVLNTVVSWHVDLGVEEKDQVKTAPKLAPSKKVPKKVGKKHPAKARKAKVDKVVV